MFEVGKQYRHSTGIYMSIVGEVNTTMWGDTLIAEASHDSYGLVPVGRDKASFANWEEVPYEEWMEQFEPHDGSSKSDETDVQADNIR